MAIMNNTSWNNAYAYIIGINRYQHINTLSFCENDAKMFEKNIKEIIPNIKTTLFEGNNFTHDKFINILNDISNIEKNKNESNVLFFYYAGHGFSYEGLDYLTCINTDMSDIQNTSIPTNRLIDAAYKSGIKTIVMIFDACRTFLTHMRSSISSFGNLTSEISRRQGIISFFSCSPGEYAQELAELSHGIFTYALVESFKECQYRTPINLNRCIVDKVGSLVQKNNLSSQIPYTTAGPIEKANLDIISGREIQLTHYNKPRCILIAGSSHSGKSDIGRYLAQQYNFGHYEMSSLAYKRYNEFKENNNNFDGAIQDFLEKELWSKNENKDIIARDFIKQYDGSTNVVISGPRLIEEIETLLNYDWDVTSLYIYAEAEIRKERHNFLQKEHSFFNELSLEDFLKKDMRELHWGLAKMATLEKFKIIINHHDIDKFHKAAKDYTDTFIKIKRDFT
jgi:adenylate kinase family enzyme